MDFKMGRGMGSGIDFGMDFFGDGLLYEVWDEDIFEYGSRDKFVEGFSD